MGSLLGSENVDIVHDLSPLFRVYKNGHMERFVNPVLIPPGLDPETGVESTDITLFPDRGVSARLFKPSPLDQNPEKRLPVLVYFHGGAFCIESTFSEFYHPYLNSLAARARVLVVSVEYRLAPEHPLPAAYDDCWDALNWVLSHLTIHNTSHSRSKAEAWIQDYTDLSRLYIGGDSAGANITHQMALRIGKDRLLNQASIPIISGIILFHPYFWSDYNRIGDEVAKLSQEPDPDFYPIADIIPKLWVAICSRCNGQDDPWINPACDPTISRLGCENVLVFVAEKDIMRDRGCQYKEVLEKSGWKGKVELVESQGEDHVFYLRNRCCPSADDLMTAVVHFLNPAA